MEANQNEALVIGHITVRDTARWAEYRSRVPATLAPWGAELVFRGRLFEVFGGDHGHTDTVVIRFPSVEASRNWFHSPAYQALIPLRQQAADVVLVGFQP